MTRDDFNEWKHHPVSKVFFKFLADKRQHLLAFSTEEWLSGSRNFADGNQTVRGQIIELGEIADLRFEAVEAFYQEEENGAETTQDGSR